MYIWCPIHLLINCLKIVILSSSLLPNVNIYPWLSFLKCVNLLSKETDLLTRPQCFQTTVKIQLRYLSPMNIDTPLSRRGTVSRVENGIFSKGTTRSGLSRFCHKASSQAHHVSIKLQRIVQFAFSFSCEHSIMSIGVQLVSPH